MNLFERWSMLLQELRAERRYRQLGPARGIDFSSNDYLGRCSRRRGDVPGCDNLTAAPRSGMASRLLRGNHAVWESVEAELARWHGAEAALMFTSGYVANEGLLATILEPGDFLASDEFNHASIVDGGRLGRAEKFIFRHNDLEHLQAGLRQARSAPGQRFVVTESLFGMDGDRAPLQEISQLCDRFDAHLIVDEAHSTGCFGVEGGGCVDETGLRDRVLATVHTGGKALGVAGAYVCGSARLRELLINRCRHFIFTTALPPALGEWWLEAIAEVRRDDDGRQRLRDRASHFRRELARYGVAAGGNHYIVPIILGSDTRTLEAAEMLQAKGYDIRAIRPPSVPPGTARLRLSLHADHDPDVLSAVAEAVGHAARSTSVNMP